MKKLELIEQVEKINANIIWEIDDSKYYGLIGWNGGKESYWLNYNLETLTKKDLLILLSKLKNKRESL